MNLEEILSRIKKCLTEPPERNPKDILITIDPGHGGKDPGAVKGNFKEKDINLEVAIRLGWLCGRHRIGFILTRFGDRYVSLKERCKRSNMTKSELFLSIHCNAAKDSRARGIETFHFPNSKNGKALAYLCQSRLKEINYTKDRGVKEAKFYVLRHTKCSAILVELGFISNSIEARFLNNENNQTLIAEKIFEFIKKICIDK